VPNSCLEAIHGSVPATCDELSDPEEVPPTICSGDPAEACTCVKEEAAEADVASGTWEVTAPGDVSIADDGDTPEPTSYCVNGDELKVQTTTEDGIVITWMATRQ
jgi:hypothetical protein